MTEKTAYSYGAENVFYLLLAWYDLRWNIKISYYERKAFWSMAEYRVCSRKGIEQLVHLIGLSYSDEIFSVCQSASAQETRYEIDHQIQAEIILCSFGRLLKTLKNCSSLIEVVNGCSVTWMIDKETVEKCLLL